MPRGAGNPQLEDGFARIAIEILEAIARTPLTDYESRCIHHLWRQTYGWIDNSGQAKKADFISYGQWQVATGIARPHVARTLSRLVERRIFSKRMVTGHVSPEWAFNKRWRTWVLPQQVTEVLPNGATPESKSTTDDKNGNKEVLPQQVTEVLPQQVTEVLPNEANTKDNKDIFKPLCLPAGGDDLLKFLQGLPGWKVDKKGDRQWLAEFMADYPEFNIRLARACRDYHSEKKAHDRAMWKNRMRSWCDHERKFEEERRVRTEGKAGGRAGRSTRPGRVPTGDELKEQRRRLNL